MEDSLSKQYLLYLRDMSRKVVYGASGSAGDYSQVLIRGSKQKQGRKFIDTFLIVLHFFKENTSCLLFVDPHRFLWDGR